MIDRRARKDYSFTEIDERLIQLSDTEVVLEFSKLLTSIYPHLIKLYANSYDPFDNIVESLFYNFVYQTFSSKYGTVLNPSEIHTYGFNLHCYHKIQHIEAKPKKFPLIVIDGRQSVQISADHLQDKEIIFLQFGDPINNLTGGVDYVNLETVNFNYSEIIIVDKKTGLRFQKENKFWVDNSLIEFELVLEDFDKEEHLYYKENLYAD